MKVRKIKTSQGTHIYPKWINVQDVRKVFQRDELNEAMTSSMIKSIKK